MRIQLVASKFPPEYAGAGLRIHRTYSRLACFGWSTERRVLTGSIQFPDSADYVYEGVSVERVAADFPNGRRTSTGPIGKLARIFTAWWEAMHTIRRLRHRQFDILHVFGSSAVTAAAIAFGAATRTPMIIELVTARASPLQVIPGLRYRPWLRRRLQRRTLLIAISEAIAQRCAEDGLMRNVWTRPNPVDTTQFFPELERRDEYRRRYTPFRPEDRVLVMVAKFMPQKNQIFLLDVLALLPSEFKLVIAGPLVTAGPLQARDATYFSELQQRIETLRLRERVLIVADFVQAAAFIRLADLYMLPNQNEGLATPMLESMACGVPVVANAEEAAFRQWVVEGKSGYLRPLEPAAWKHAIVAALAIPVSERLAVAREVANRASAEFIDADFRRLVGALSTLTPDDVLDVSGILREQP